MKKLQRDGVRPEIVPLFDVSDIEHWQHIEQFFIAAARSFELPITNATKGGDGLIAPSKDVRARMSASHKVRMSDVSTREHCSKKQKTNWTDPAYRQRMIEMQKAMASTEEGRARLLAASKRASESLAQPAHAKKLSDKRKALWADPEYYAKVMRGRALSGRYPNLARSMV